MNEHIKLFETHSDYEEYINSQDKILPNVSYCKNLEKIHYNPLDYSKDYLTFVALDDCTFKFTPSSYYSLVSNSIDYSIDGGNTWETLEPNEESPVVTAGNKIMWKSTTLKNDGTSGSGNFQSSGHYIAQGNIMSLLYGDEFEGKTVINKGNVFGYLFSRSDRELIDVTNLILPATTLTDSCYASMFLGCTNLTTAPVLPAIMLAQGCYSGMFYGCTSLATAPELPATTLANYCYATMFQGCTNLTTAPELHATTLAISCYSSMFYGCTSLITAPELPATTLASSCYNYMFQGCTSLNYIKAMFTTKPSSTYTNNWVSGVSATGTFVKNSAATWTTTGANGVPNGWTVQTASE